MPRSITILLIIISGALLALPFIFPSRHTLLNRPIQRSMQIVDCHGSLLREILSDNNYISHYVTLDSISPYLIMATIASEDKRFFVHNGIDPFAIIRSALQNVIEQRTISGASTITQQLARNLLNSTSRNIFWKLNETSLALIIELKLSKFEILELYLNSAPYGNLAYGVEAASQLYFRKSARDLTCSESALLAVLPRAPSFYNPYHYPDRSTNAQRNLLNRMLGDGYIDSACAAEAINHLPPIVPKEKNFIAPHFCEYVLKHVASTRQKIYRIATTIDPEIQHSVEEIIANNLARLEDANVSNAAVIVLEIKNLALRAYVGSRDFFDPKCGEVDGVQSLRQPGSSIKPFTYALAIENGMTPADLVPDLPTYEATISGDYHPRNYDEKYHGLVRIRTALACSYNVPAVKVLEKVGVDKLWRCLIRSGFNSLSKSPVHYGLGLTLGNGEVTLFELTRAFSIFASAGYLRPVNFISSINNEKIPILQKRTKIFSPSAIYIIGDILNDNNARGPAFGEFSPLNLPFFCSVKTGTSKDYRDNWCVGYTSNYIVGVWVGNFDGSPMNQVSGITGAAPIFRDIMLFLHRELYPVRPAMPESIMMANICALSGQKSTSMCDNVISELFIRGKEPCEYCNHILAKINNQRAMDMQFHQSLTKQSDFRIVFPDHGDIFKIDPILKHNHQQIRLQILTTYDLNDVTWYVDGQRLGKISYPYSYYWQLNPGDHTITASAFTGSSDEILTDSVKILVLE